MSLLMPGVDEKIDELFRRLDELNRNLREFPKGDELRAPQERRWERFALIDGGLASGAGAITIGSGSSNLRPCPTGWEAYITAIAITATGASSGATVVVYNGEVSDQNLLDQAQSMFGSAPSRLVAFYDPETVYVEQGDALSIVLASTAASAEVTVRVTGKRRMT